MEYQDIAQRYKAIVQQYKAILKMARSNRSFYYNRAMADYWGRFSNWANKLFNGT
jgi:hypothetical protein